MRFLWFGKKKKSAPEIELTPTREPEEVFSVTGYQCVSSPITGSKSVELTHQVINSVVLSLLSEEHSPADIAAQEFFQQQGANVLPVRDYSSNSERGLSARVEDGDTTRTVLIGSPEVIARATTPFCSEIAAAVESVPDSKVVAIDGIAYATYSITRELI